MTKKNDIPVIEPKDIFIGDQGALVTLTEFADYETEASVKAHEVVKKVLKLYPGKVRFSFRHFPMLSTNQKAHKAAEAAIGAAQEGKFLEMHETLLQNRRNLGTISLKQYAREAGVTSKDFLNDLINSKYGWYVQDDLKEGINLGIKEIPAFFLNGKKLEGAITVRNLKAKIDEALQQLSRMPKKETNN
jgi:protein-disulfide isomerase